MVLLKAKMTRDLGKTAIFIQEANKLRGERGRTVRSGLIQVASKVDTE